MTHALGNELKDDEGNTLATFKTHWQAVAAMIRLTNPDFRSIGGDEPEALHSERVMRERMNSIRER